MGLTIFKLQRKPTKRRETIIWTPSPIPIIRHTQNAWTLKLLKKGSRLKKETKQVPGPSHYPCKVSFFRVCLWSIWEGHAGADRGSAKPGDTNSAPMPPLGKPFRLWLMFSWCICLDVKTLTFCQLMGVPLNCSKISF